MFTPNDIEQLFKARALLFERAQDPDLCFTTQQAMALAGNAINKALSAAEVQGPLTIAELIEREQYKWLG